MNEQDERRGRMCYACGERNERGFHMSFSREGERTVCTYTPCQYQQGFPGRLHGGVVATMIDEAMGWAVYHARAWGATARLNVRYRKPVPLDGTLRIEAWVVRDRHRLMELRAEVRDASGEVLAEGEGTFMKLDGRTGSELSELARKAGRSDAPEVVT
ncbi:MAG: PaaI family thioesterase [Dehalococcoidia bacterium]